MPSDRPYDPTDFPPFAVTVDLVILTMRAGQLCALMVRRSSPPFRNAWSLPGGFVAVDEALECAARRKLEAKTGVESDEIHLEQLGTYGMPNRDPRMRVVSVAYLAFAANLPEPAVDESGLEPRWRAVDPLLEESLAFDHGRILRDGIERARAKLEYTTLATCFCPAEFSLAQLRDVYEVVWATVLDAPNFRRKVLAAEGFLVATERSAQQGKGRPALLYRAGPALELQPPFKRSPA